MQNCFENLQKIEFVVTYACTGKCRHCSEGEHSLSGCYIDGKIAADTVKRLVEAYPINTVMTFGGEPLLYPESVFAIQSMASDLGVLKRQVITNGYFSKDVGFVSLVAKRLKESGVNDLLLSVDAFHQEFIPIDAVKRFATFLLQEGVPVKAQPAWLGSKQNENPYNLKTRLILQEFKSIGIDENDGNNVFPEGNALKNFPEYFIGKDVKNPYVQDNNDIKCLSFDPDGSVLGGNVYTQDIFEIMKAYKP